MNESKPITMNESKPIETKELLESFSKEELIDLILLHKQIRGENDGND